MIFVSAIFCPQDEGGVHRKLESYLALGRHLVAATVPLRVYTSPDIVDRLLCSWEGLPTFHVEVRTDVDVEDLWKLPDLILPQNRTVVKDTAYYMCVQMSKLKFMAHAATSSEHLIWVDFGIFHMIRDTAMGQDTLRSIAEALPRSSLSSRLLSPGGYMHSQDIWNETSWKFLGSALFGTAQAFTEAYENQKRIVLDNLPKLTWEINYWCMMDHCFEIYDADHDDRILFLALYAINKKQRKENDFSKKEGVAAEREVLSKAPR
jgi:hypothetical protein